MELSAAKPNSFSVTTRFGNNREANWTVDASMYLKYLDGGWNLCQNGEILGYVKDFYEEEVKI